MVVIDHDTGRLVWAGQGQTKAALQGFFDLLGPERCAEITHVSADSAGYIADVVAGNCPDAVQVADPFHVVKWANDALGEVRLEVWRETRRIARANSRGRGRAPLDAGEEFPAHQRVRMLTRSRYALWKNPENLTENQRAKLDWIAATDDRLWRAYQLKEGLRTIFKLPPDEARPVLDNWIASASRCQIPPSSTSPGWSGPNAGRSCWRSSTTCPTGAPSRSTSRCDSAPAWPSASATPKHSSPS